MASLPEGHPDKDSMVAIFDETGGPQWHDRVGWQEEPPDAVVLRDDNGDEVKLPLKGVSTSTEGRVQQISLKFNNIEGVLDGAMFQLAHLQTLDLQGNELQGLIPPSIVELRSLRSLNLAQNFLVGSIPTLEGSLNRLRHLSLRNNSLGGSLYSKLPRGLETLNLSGNNFDGEIIRFRMKRLRIVRLDDNKLEGNIHSLPSTITEFSARNNLLGHGMVLRINTVELVHLRKLDLTGNAFCLSAESESSIKVALPLATVRIDEIAPRWLTDGGVYAPTSASGLEHVMGTAEEVEPTYREEHAQLRQNSADLLSKAVSRITAESSFESSMGSY